MRTFFFDLQQLAELPWFELVDGRPVLDARFGPCVDVHTHLSLSFVAPSTVDHDRRTDVVETYLPEVDRPFDLEPYGNRNFTPGDLRRMKRDLVAGSFLPGGPRRTHTAANLVSRMRDMQMSHAVIHAIDLPYVSRNSEAYLAAARTYRALVPFGSAHPAAAGAVARVHRLADAGARGLKVHPASQGIAPDDPRAMRLYAACRERGLPVLWHCGPVGIETAMGRTLSQVRLYEKPIADFPDVTFILGHSGALQADEAIELSRRHPNVVLDLSCQGVRGVRAVLERADTERVCNGSDWPFYHQALGVARLLIAADGDEALARRVLGGNARRILGLDDPPS
jgi:hypothetical protein